MLKSRFSFFKYYEEEEKKDGDYWKYLDITLEEEIELNLDLRHFEIYEKIIKQIKNEELKKKMTNKLKELIKTSPKLSYEDVRMIFELFTPDEQIEVIENKVKKVDLDSMNFSNLIEVIMMHKEAQIEWKISQITNILEKIEDVNQIISFIKQIKGNDRVYYEVIKNMKHKLPNKFFKYLSITENPKYIQEKIEEYKKDNIKIGIDPKISVGVEIEANAQHPFDDFLDSQTRSGLIRTQEATTDIEIITTKELHDTDEEVAKLRAICDTMTELGYYYDEEHRNAAGQINLGLDYLDTAQSILVFYEIFGNCEELLWYISNESGQIARQNIYINSRMKAISEIIGTRVLDEDIIREEVIKLFNSQLLRQAKIEELQYKKNTVCLRGEDNSDWRFEIRIPNGGCNAKTWIDNIRLYGKMMEISKKIADIMMKKEITKEEENLLRLKIELQNKKLSLEEKLDILMDLLFDKEEIKEIYYERFQKTKERIIETGTKKYKKTAENHEPGFGEVEFQGQYGKKTNPDDIHMGRIVASYDSETGEYYDEAEPRPYKERR